MNAPACSACGITSREVNRDRHGELLCLRCYLKRGYPDDGAGAGKPCPGCAERRGGRYRAPGGRMLCWPCLGLSSSKPTPVTYAEWEQFRKGIVDKLVALDPGRFVYIDADRVVGCCPVCRAARPEYVAVRFHGRAPRAEIRCSLGCPDVELAEAFAIRVKP